jgi:multidrug transporter EmrE-like cation transporter
MDFDFVLGISFGMLASLMMNIGKGVQKQKVQVFRQGRKIFARSNRADLVIWLFGFALTAGSALPYSVGLMLSRSPSAISAMTGVGLIGLSVYATRVIGERMRALDLMGMTLVIVGTCAMAFSSLERAETIRQVSERSLAWMVLALILAGAVGCIVARYHRRFHGLAWGLAAGLSIGLAIFVADVGLVRSDGSLLGQLGTPYPYIALTFAGTATVLTQVGFLHGRALEVVPSVNVATMLTPLLFERVIYGQAPDPVTVLLMVSILAGVFFLSTGAVARAST